MYKKVMNEADDEKYKLCLRRTRRNRTKHLCHVRGNMHKKVRIAAQGIIFSGLQDYQDDKADMILKYMPDEARLSKALS